MGWEQNGSSRKEDGKRTGIEYYYNMKHENGQETLKQTMHTKLFSSSEEEEAEKKGIHDNNNNNNSSNSSSLFSLC